MRQLSGRPPRHAVITTQSVSDLDQRGQALPFFAVLLTGLIMTAALVIDGGGTLVRYRQIQNAADAAATAASHQFGDVGCADAGGARAPVVQAAQSSVREHLPAFPLASISVSCPSGHGNYAVTVRLVDVGQATFMRLMNSAGLQMSVKATAINRLLGSSLKYGMLALNPGNPGWIENSGCPSLQVLGSATLDSFKPVHANSRCTAIQGYAVLVSGSASAVIRNGLLTSVGAITGRNITPAPLSGQPVEPDPYASLAGPNPATLPLRSSSRLTISRTQVLLPGIYRGGIEVSGTALLQPGVYYIDGGGILVTGHGKLLAVNAGVTVSDPSRWATDCTTAGCGVLIYNSGGLALMGAMEFGGTTTVKLRGYNPPADVLGLDLTRYSRIALWQDRTPVPTPILKQPVMALHGNPDHDINGVVYLPSAKALIHGSPGFSIAVAVIAFDVEIRGSAAAVIRDDVQALPQIYDYGLLE